MYHSARVWNPIRNGLPTLVILDDAHVYAGTEAKLCLNYEQKISWNKDTVECCEFSKNDSHYEN